MVLERDHWMCQQCLREGIETQPASPEIDHIKPANTHPHLRYDLDNLQTLCKRCHSRKTHAEGIRDGR